MWKTIQFNKQNIEYETERAMLIKLPQNGSYKGYKFWHPSKLIREMKKGKGYFLTLSYTDDFNFKIFKTNKKGEKISEETVDGEEIALQFGMLTEANEESYLEVTEPVKIDKEVKVIKELER